MNTHARFCAAILVECDTVDKGAIFEMSAAVVHPEMIRRSIVSHEDVDASVAVEVGGNNSEAVACCTLQAGCR